MSEYNDGLLYVIVFQELPPPLAPDKDGTVIVWAGNDAPVKAHWKVFDDWTKADLAAQELARTAKASCRIMSFPDFRVL